MNAITLRHVVSIVFLLCMGVLHPGDLQEKQNISASVLSECSGSKPPPSSMWSSDASKSVKLRPEFTVIRVLMCCLVIASVAAMRRLFPLKRVSAYNNISNNLPCQRVDKDGPPCLEKGSDSPKENSLEKQLMADNSSAIPKETISGGGDLKRSSPHSKRSSPHSVRHHRESHSSTTSIFSSDKRETSSATKSLRLIEEEMECRTKILESEKNDLQQTLEKEVDRRSNEWASMLGKIRSEERKMRKRIQDLAEQNVQLQKEVSSWKNSVWMQEEILKENSCISYDESLKQHAENPEAYQQEQQHRESEEVFKQLKQELKAKTLLVKLLREKLCSNVADVEQTEEKVATFERSQEVLRSNIERLQARLTFSNQKEKYLELLLGGKENTIKCLQTDLEECQKELTLLRAEIPKVSEERNGFQQDAEQLTLQNIKLIAEVGTLKLRVNKLDEDVLVREGQLSILQDCLREKFFKEL